MTPELFWLVITVALTAVFWIPYVGNRLVELGPPPMAWFPPRDPPPRAAWAGRAMQAHANAVENLVIFAPLALAVHLTGSTPATAISCLIYALARAAHYLVTILGLPIPFRTLAFLVGFGCQVTLAAALIGRAW